MSHMDRLADIALCHQGQRLQEIKISAVMDDLRDQMIIPGLLEHEVHMTRPVRMPLQQLEQLANRPIMRDRIRHWNDGLEPKDTLLVALHHTASVWSIAILVLYIVLSIAIGLPDIDLDSFDRFALCILDIAEHKTWLALWIM